MRFASIANLIKVLLLSEITVHKSLEILFNQRPDNLFGIMI
jgi:hypothetical protein